MSIFILRREKDGAFKVGQSGRGKAYVREMLGGGVTFDSAYNGGPAAQRELHSLLDHWKIVRGTKAHHDDWFTADCELQLREWLSTRGAVEIEGVEMPASPKSNIIRLRLTALEKQDWTTAAGGTGKLSEWVRSVCNAAAQPAVRPGMTDLMVSPEAIDAALAADPPPNEKPKLVRDAVERAINETGVQGSGLAKQLRAPAQCDRWMHHRPGVYCGSCKKVIGK